MAKGKLAGRMDKEEYIQWKATRGDNAAEWNRETCYKADQLIQRTALENFNRYTRQFDKPVQEYLNSMVRVHFGSIETDHLLIALKCYPDWM